MKTLQELQDYIKTQVEKHMKFQGHHKTEQVYQAYEAGASLGAYLVYKELTQKEPTPISPIPTWCKASLRTWKACHHGCSERCHWYDKNSRTEKGLRT